VATLIPQSSESLSIPNPAEVRKRELGDRGANIPLSQGRIECANAGRRFDEHEAVCQRIVVEARSLGFAVKAGQAVDSLPADLILTKGAHSFAVEIASPSAPDHELETVRRCLAAGVTSVALVSSEPERLRTLAQVLHAGLPLAQAMEVGYFTPEEFSSELVRLAQTKQTALKRKEQP